MKQLNFLWLLPSFVTEDNFLLPTGKRKKKRRKKTSSPAQKWAFQLFVRPQLILEFPNKRYYATGCSCSIVVKNGSVQPSPCRQHQCLEQAFFEAPFEEILKVKLIEEEKQKYFSLPMAPLDAEKIKRLSKVAIPWFCLNDQGLGRAQNWKGEKFTMEPCGCLFTAREIKTSRAENQYRAGHWWYAVKVSSCCGVDRDCHYEHLPINPRLQ
ncbi:hypothetical protein KKF47_02960 [Patescibacteria group bacterium]|nr:hypothetical protein [Patescibacteria group bacterium]